MDLAPRRIIARTTTAQLIDLIAIEVKEPIDLVITVAEIALPSCVPWIQEVDITLPARGKAVEILIPLTILGLSIERPSLLHTIFCSSLPRPKAEVIEDRLHPVAVL